MNHDVNRQLVDYGQHVMDGLIVMGIVIAAALLASLICLAFGSRR